MYMRVHAYTKCCVCMDRTIDVRQDMHVFEEEVHYSPVFSLLSENS